MGIVFSDRHPLDAGQNLAAIHLGKVQIQQDKVRTRGIGMHPLPPQKGHGLYAVGSDMHVDGAVGIAEGFLGQPDIAWAVFDQENFYLCYVMHSVPADGSLTFVSQKSLMPLTSFRMRPAAQAW